MIAYAVLYKETSGTTNGYHVKGIMIIMVRESYTRVMLKSPKKEGFGVEEREREIYKVANALFIHK